MQANGTCDAKLLYSAAWVSFTAAISLAVSRTVRAVKESSSGGNRWHFVMSGALEAGWLAISTVWYYSTCRPTQILPSSRRRPKANLMEVLAESFPLPTVRLPITQSLKCSEPCYTVRDAVRVHFPWLPDQQACWRRRTSPRARQTYKLQKPL